MPIFADAVAHWRSCVVFAGLELGIFDALHPGALPLETLAVRIGAPARPLRMLCEALVAVGLLERAGDALRNAPVAQTYLASASPASLRDAVLFNARSYAIWGQLAQAVRRGSPAADPRQILGGDPAATRQFVLAMHARAQGVARALVDLLDLRRCRRMLDLGGGPGTYAALLAAKYPALRVTVMDLPPILAVAEELLRGRPERDRLALWPGDMFHDDLGGDWDAVLLSGVLHRAEADERRRLLARVAQALAPGGIAAMSDVFCGRPEPGPVLPELFALHMMLIAEHGGCPHLDEVRADAESVGLAVEKVAPFPAPLPHTLVIARRPAGPR